ncbi:MAG: PadR family transcriptional regulator [Eubacteriales bacterium]|nr:PadR family transcriptional regulator [Eubacteriales bacterium]
MIPIIPLYILGLLQRFGPQHGYQIKKTIVDQLSDFTQIKLPTIYYHLEKLESGGLLLAGNEKPGSRPEKKVYSVTEKGIEAFQTSLERMLSFEYRPVFPFDSVFYFSEHLEKKEITGHLKTYIEELDHTMIQLKEHKRETLKFVPEEMRLSAEIIFSHHERHYQSERDWASEALNILLKQEELS